jgi:hypothetical protein
VIGLASTAPAYSLAATLGYVVVAVGDRARRRCSSWRYPDAVLALKFRAFFRGETLTAGTPILVPDNGELPRGL